MKKTKIFTTALFTLAATLGFSQEALTESAFLNVSIPQVSVSNPSKKDIFTYFKVGIADPRSDQGAVLVPGFGLGWRAISGASALDVSLSLHAGGRQHGYLFTLPKVNYLHYLRPVADSSMYFGGGLAYGGMRHFVGLIPNLAVGYEIKDRKSVV